MSYHCERCGAHLDDLATQCGCDLPPTKAEIDRARIGHATPIMDAVIAERDRLAADVDARDEVIGRLLAMLDPGSGQLGRIEDDKTISLTITEWNLLVTAHERACEIAGRTE